MKRTNFMFFVALILASCSTGGEGDPAETVEAYIQAKVDSDVEVIGALLCTEMEAQLERESRTFESVSDVSIEGMDCQRDGDTDTVRCEGRIVALYGAEETEFPLISYRVVQEVGEWKWCGEAP